MAKALIPKTYKELLLEIKDLRSRLNECDERFKSVAEASPVGMGVVGIPDGDYLYINPAYAQYLGYDKNELLSRRAPEIYFDLNDRYEILKKLKEDNFVTNYEVQLKRKDGSSFWTMSSIRPIKYLDQTAFLGTFIDITKRKETEEALRNSEQRLNNNFENSPLAAIEWDSDYHITQWTKEAERIFGWNKEEVMGKPIHELNIIYEEDIPIVERTMVRLSSGRENRLVSSNRNYTKNRDVRDCVWYNSVILDENGQMSSVMSLVDDVTENLKIEKLLRESQEKLWSVLNATQESVYMFDKDGKIIMSNLTGLKRLNVMSEENLIGHHFSEFMSPERAKFRQLKLDEVYLSGKPLEFEDERAGMIFHHNFFPVIKNNEVTNIVTYSTDITGFREGTEQLILKLNEELLRSNKELESFAYVASHDLQEPLRMITSFTQLLAKQYEDRLDEKAKEYIGFTVEGAKRMYDLINGLLAYSRIQTRGREFSMVNLQEIVRRVKINLDTLCKERNINFCIEKLPSVMADELQMGQLMQNLIGNAVKFSKNNTSVIISSRREKDHYVIAVKDEGIGIESHYFEKIFTIFQRLFPKGEYEGTGIGLAICKRIVERHGGEIWVESEPGKGSTFYFTIPVINKK